MLSVVGIFALCIVSFVALVAAAYAVDRRHRPRLPPQERAFDEYVNVDPMDLQQLTRLRNKVDRIGLIRVPILDGRHYEPDSDAYQVWLIDELGAIHDLLTTNDLQYAARIARRLADEFQVDLIDDEGLAG